MTPLSLAVVVGVVVFVGVGIGVVVVVAAAVVMFKLLHLAEICTLTSAFWFFLLYQHDNS